MNVRFVSKVRPMIALGALPRRRVCIGQCISQWYPITVCLMSMINKVPSHIINNIIHNVVI